MNQAAPTGLSGYRLTNFAPIGLGLLIFGLQLNQLILQLIAYEGLLIEFLFLQFEEVLRRLEIIYQLLILSLQPIARFLSDHKRVLLLLVFLFLYIELSLEVDFNLERLVFLKHKTLPPLQLV